MGRAELRRQRKKEEKMLGALNKIGFPEFRHPLAPIRMTNLTDQEAANMTGVKIGALEQWRKEQTEQIRKEVTLEMQERLSSTEEFITAGNIITTLKALEGFRYAKSAANHILENYFKVARSYDPHKLREIYEDLHEKWGIEFEFDEFHLNKMMGFDDVDWMYEYIGRHIPFPVYEKIWNDSRNIQSVLTQLSVLWELCEEFGFAKHKSGSGNMLEKFMKGTKEKYDRLDEMQQGVTYATKLLKEKYDVEIGWGEGTRKTLDRFNL